MTPSFFHTPNPVSHHILPSLPSKHYQNLTTLSIPTSRALYQVTIIFLGLMLSSSHWPHGWNPCILLSILNTTVVVNFLKWHAKLDHVISHFNTPWLTFISFKQSAKVHKVPPRPSVIFTFLSQQFYFLILSSGLFFVATLSSSIHLICAENTPPLGHLYWLFILPRMFFSPTCL